MTTTKPMLAKSQEDLPRGDGWRYEPKWDGFRAIVTRDTDGVRIDSRGDRPLGRYFPELVELLAGQPPATYVMDGEIVMIANGVMDFETLQLRLHPAASRVNKLAGEIPATLVAFDLLELDSRDVRPLDTDERRVELEALIERLGAELAPDSPGGLHPGPLDRLGRPRLPPGRGPEQPRPAEHEPGHEHPRRALRHRDRRRERPQPAHHPDGEPVHAPGPLGRDRVEAPGRPEHRVQPGPGRT